MKNIILILLIFSAVLWGCQKGVDGNNNTGTTPPVTGDVYLVTTKDSYWKYKVTQGATSSTVTLTSTGQQQTFDGIAYNVFANSPSTSGYENSYLGLKDHKYYTRVKGNSPNTGAPFDLTFLYLNDTASVGYQWNFDAGQGNGFTAKAPGTIVEKNSSQLILGKVYTNIIHSTLHMQYVLPVVGLTEYGTYDYYVARDIGIVKIVFTGSPQTGSVQTVSEIMEYSIK